MFVSKSLPSLDTICWASPSDSEDEIDELLSDQSDQDNQHVTDFYSMERKRVRAEKMFEPNNNEQGDLYSM